MSDHEAYLREAAALARDNAARGGRPYGALIVRDGEVLVRAVNTLVSTNDPTAHAELLALREAGQRLGRTKLDDCVVYASGRPCPMCHAAMRLAGVQQAYFAYTAEEAEGFGLLSADIYAELCRPLAEQPMRVEHRPIEIGEHPYAVWRARQG